ncbi:DMT family transporter [Spirilliplanes yamanashiensis]|uniref:Membrane protein n=1 Tax=Spirilliplanes yamanashiensis TaxID=42233 RepID=A0A8J4DLP2_9ACTN|nr:DMT family transporter [Spirilliplanes yamanashiensis]MDP9818989.1 drug/metabolite transporter (DMT)-like permease [Spirilliplanes yamanashiensis]GIJ05444.1 membrane protein [Spirilliplanes yamanashiensis]
MSRRGWILFAAMSLIWGIPYLLIKIAVEGLPVPVLVFARTAVGAAVLLPLALRGNALAGVRRHWRPVLAFAAIEIMVPWFLLSDAEQHITSSLTGLLIAATPVVAVVAARLTGDRERLGPLRWAGLAVGFGGVAVLAGPALAGGAPWPIAEVLIVAVCYAVAPIIASRHLADVPSLPLTAVCLAVATVVYTPAAVVTWPSAWPAADVLVALAALALVCTALAMVLFFSLIREVGGPRAVVITYVNPAVAVAAGALVLDEPVTVQMVVAFALILAGSVLAAGRRRPEAPAVPEPAAAAAAAQPPARTSPDS